MFKKVITKKPYLIYFFSCMIMFRTKFSIFYGSSFFQGASSGKSKMCILHSVQWQIDFIRRQRPKLQNAQGGEARLSTWLESWASLHCSSKVTLSLPKNQKQLFFQKNKFLKQTGYVDEQWTLESGAYLSGDCRVQHIQTQR